MPKHCLTCGAQLSGAAKRSGKVLCRDCLAYHEYKEELDARLHEKKEAPTPAPVSGADQAMGFCEAWIENKLRERLGLYKKRYPGFDMDRVLKEVLMWDTKRQRWAPYMKDADIKSINRSHHRLKSLQSLARNEHL